MDFETMQIPSRWLHRSMNNHRHGIQAQQNSDKAKYRLRVYNLVPNAGVIHYRQLTRPSSFS
jgi:hypothetical protein